MPTTLSLALVGYWHVHAADYANEVAGLTNARLSVSWDDDSSRGAEGAAELGIEFDPDLDAILARDDIDGVVITTATSQHTEIIGKAIAAGKHVFTEKLLASTVEECEELIAAARTAGVSLVVSLPRLSEGMTRTIAALIEGGRLGEVTYSRVRLAHDGSVAGWLPSRFYDPVDAIGGALADLGCHAVYLTQRFLGAPSHVTAVYSQVTGEALEDNAVVTLRYPSGALAVVESSNVTTPGASTIEVRGTKASIVYGFAGVGLVGKGEGFDDERWTPIESAPDDPSPLTQWVRSIETGERLSDNNSAAVELTRLVVASNESARTGQTLDYTTSLN